MIDAGVILPLAAFAFSTLITPGPNNMMVTASAVNFGFARTVAHIAGICIGFSAMTFLVGAGLGEVFRQSPRLHSVMGYAAFFFVFWIAWRIAFAGIGEESAKKRPMTFLQAALFQWVNPKAWAMAAGATTAFMGGGAVFLQAAMIAGVFLFFSFPCVSLWGLFGAGIGGFLKKNPLWLRCFNVTMALMLIAAMLPTIL